MALEAYSPCPCGSGKKFKWCCQPIHVEIDRALRQDEEGQHEAALRLMNEVVEKHPTNPEAFGRLAQLLYNNDRVEEAEAALDKAFAINPNYPFGYLLRGMFRAQEGEIPGALLLFRKAAEVYDPEARDILADVYARIGQYELQLNRPVAARAALKISLRFRAQENLRDYFDELFKEGSNTPFPASARKEYSFKSPSARSSPDRLASWERALTRAATGKLVDVLLAFEQLTQEYPEDPSAWYNLALARAWVGDNPRALQAIEQYIQLQSDEKHAAGAWALGEVLRLGQGMEEQSDYLQYLVVYPIRDPNRFFQALDEWGRRERLTGLMANEEQGVLQGIVVEKGTALTPELQARLMPRFAAYLTVAQGALRLAGVSEETVQRMGQEIASLAGGALQEPPYRGKTMSRFSDVWAPMLVFPIGITDQQEAETRVREEVRKYFEGTWVQQPRRSLDGKTPAEAAADPILRKKLLGVIQFIEECGNVGAKQPYAFDDLRRNLGLIEGGAPRVAEAVPAAAPRDLSALSAEELTSLNVEGLEAAELEQAYQGAQQRGTTDAARRLAQALVSLPADKARSDRYAWHGFLIQRLLADSDFAGALSQVEEGQRFDCEHNEGRRRNDYEMRRGQVLLKSGEADQARDVFQRLIERAPAELQYRVAATEAMLSARKGSHALQFAEQGLTLARQRNDRDSEAHFQELVGAARKLGG